MRLAPIDGLLFLLAAVVCPRRSRGDREDIVELTTDDIHFMAWIRAWIDGAPVAEFSDDDLKTLARLVNAGYARQIRTAAYITGDGISAYTEALEAARPRRRWLRAVVALVGAAAGTIVAVSGA